MMKSKQFVAKVTDIAKNYKTLYVMGCFGAPLNSTNKVRYCNNHDYNKQASRQKMIKSASADTFGFDCVNLIKGVLWGWSGDKSKTYGGASYNINNVPDIGADTMITRCNDVKSTGWTSMKPGEVVWKAGHIGVYIGDGLAVEATPAWKNKVQITAVANIGSKSGYASRTWTKHGFLPYVDYSDLTATTEKKTESNKTDTVKSKTVKASKPAQKFNAKYNHTYVVKNKAGINIKDDSKKSSKTLVTIPYLKEVRCFGYYNKTLTATWVYVQLTKSAVTYTGFCKLSDLKRK